MSYSGGLCLCLLLTSAVQAADPPYTVRVGSKKFTESVILGEMACQLIRSAGGQAVHRDQLGGTQFLWKALLADEIDLYPEYTGTLLKDVFPGTTDLEASLREQGMRMSRSLGFSNSYGLGMRAELARQLGVRTIADLSSQPMLTFGLSEEFYNRPDGWQPLQRHHGMKVAANRVKVLDHDLCFRGLASGDLDVMDVYTTEGGIRLHDLLVLKDSQRFFPEYEAVWVYRADLPERLRIGADSTSPELTALLRVQGLITPEQMIEMNLRASREPNTEAQIAADYLRQRLDLSIEVESESTLHLLLRLTGEHLTLVGVSLLLAVLVAVPIGVLATRHAVVGQIILGTTGVLQTVPQLALLVMLIPLLGIGPRPAIAALFLYSLLPIVRNTYTGLRAISPSLRESAEALGLPAWTILRKIELPLASASILAGIKTAAVINVGTATLGALIAAGGYGQPIVTGIRTSDTRLILLGAIPAALLALLVQGAFELSERWLIPRGLRLQRE